MLSTNYLQVFGISVIYLYLKTFNRIYLNKFYHLQSFISEKKLNEYLVKQSGDKDNNWILSNFLHKQVIKVNRKECFMAEIQRLLG